MTLLRASRYALAALIIAGLMWQLERQNPAVLLALPVPSPAALVVAFVLGTASYFAFATAWVQLRAHHGTWRDAAGGWFASLFARYVPGSVWQGAVRVVDAHIAGQSKRRMLERYFAEQALACFSAASIAMALVPIARLPIGRPVLVALAAVAIIALAASRAGPRLGISLQWTTGAVAAMAVAHLAIALGFAAFASAWVHPANLGEIVTLMAAFLIAGVAGLLAVFAPAGLGVREAVLAALLAPTLGSANAIAVALGARLWLLVCELAAWALWFLASRRHALRKRRPRPCDEHTKR